MILHGNFRRLGRSSGCQRAFTLIELLVVISIIALLISILFPSLTAARQRAKESTCLGKLKGIASAGLTYASDDPRENAIPVHPLLFGQGQENPTFIGAYEWGGKSGVGHPGRAEGPTDGPHAWVSSQFGTKAGTGPDTRPLNHVLYTHGFKDNLRPEYDRGGALRDTRLDLPAYRCPGDDGPPRGRADGRGPHCPDWILHTERSSYDQFGNSYAANLYWVNGSDQTFYSWSPFLVPLSRIANPSRTLLFEENIGRWAWLCKRGSDLWTTRVLDPGPTKAVRGWHGRDWTFNRAFCDGHAASQKVLIEGTEDAEGYSFHFRHEVVPVPSEAGRTRTAWTGQTVRGPGWQKDILPTRIQTRIPGLNGPENDAALLEGCVTPIGE